MERIFKDILLSSVYDIAKVTPLDKAEKLSLATGNAVFVKREDLQPVFSFKIRGAYNRISRLTPEERGRGVICASAGNHAQGVAISCQRLGIVATVVMPRTTPQIKIDAVKSYGADVILHGDSYTEAGLRCQELSQETGAVYIHPFDDPLVIAGQGTIGKEIIEECAGVDAIYVPVGGGGLLAGIACYVKTLCPHVKIIGVEPDDSDAMHVSIQNGRNTILEEVGIFAEGVAVKQVGQINFEIAMKHVDDFVTVTTDEICSAIKKIYEEFRVVLEPAGALSLAGLLKHSTAQQFQNKRLVCISSGANMNFQRLQFVAERTLTGEGKEALFAVRLREERGALYHFCSRGLQDKNITEFNYRINSTDEAYIFLGIAIGSESDKKEFENRLIAEHYAYTDLTGNELAKLHIRHMVGGTSAHAVDERLYRVEFPERPHALGDFLKLISGRWNISLFHYRSHGTDFGRVLIGLQIPEAERQEFQSFLYTHKYHLKDETENPAYKLFLNGAL